MELLKKETSLAEKPKRQTASTEYMRENPEAKSERSSSTRTISNFNSNFFSQSGFDELGEFGFGARL